MFWKKKENYEEERRLMVERQIKSRGVKNKAVLEAMAKVKRHRFIPDNLKAFAYADEPQPIGEGQTISQPYIVALMTELLDPKPEDRVLEVGAGSGYQAAVLAELVHHVYTLEIIPNLAKRCREVLENLGYKNVTILSRNGFDGLPEEAPFDKIMITAAPLSIPEALKDQLKMGGRLVVPVGDVYQVLYLVKKDESGCHSSEVIPVRFVPMTGGR
ncbi:protein-L-isoaspartate(D-aspartate) O-methyltransferase [Candidatus Sumerlaeota bacterium]|nr:protein-L-isoaspartate(D-aspartate) O-methyltransferase [Candidatus Sumerlaeota bacterium]